VLVDRGGACVVRVVVTDGGGDETGADGGVRPHCSTPAATVVSTTSVVIGR
jgi:hypothetical protein